ncbi:uncharacterized protein A4U43_C06F18090 [Asparagus officinalis]|uniref:Uncharacterized protein n=1 Tax=Asparagus officinalis TaxID=4686 RepID=A0A5P1ET54_ASPOF|nr:uncharacterized protein A4U43_C06F18090 [Asparagus officinalis]
MVANSLMSATHRQWAGGSCPTMQARGPRVREAYFDHSRAQDSAHDSLEKENMASAFEKLREEETRFTAGLPRLNESRMRLDVKFLLSR